MSAGVSSFRYASLEMCTPLLHFLVEFVELLTCLQLLQVNSTSMK